MPVATISRSSPAQSGGEMFAMSKFAHRPVYCQGRQTVGMQSLRGSDTRRSEFARRMRAARLHAGVSQKDAAEAIGIKQPTLSVLELDANKSAHTAKAAQVYGVSATWLQDGTGQMLDGVSKLSARASYIAAQLDAIKDPMLFDRACVLCEAFAALAQAGLLPTSAADLANLAGPALAPTQQPHQGRTTQSVAGRRARA